MAESRIRNASFFVALSGLSLLSIGSGSVGEASKREIQVPSAAQVSHPTLTPVATGLSFPVYLTNARDGTNRLFIVEQTGAIKVLQPGSMTPTVFLNISSKILFGGEQGLLGLAFHPEFETNRRFFVNYTRSGDGSTVIAEYQALLSDPDIADTTETVLLTISQPFANHNGGMVEFGPDGFLYIGMGDGGAGFDPGNRAQNIDELLGKMLRINIDVPNGPIPYSSPPDNPFFGSTAGRDEIYAIGFRNPFRFSFDRSTGTLFVGDVGQGVREEVAIATLGSNQGWRVFEGTLCTTLDPTLCSAPGFTPPITEYSHTPEGRCAIIGGYAYRGTISTLPVGAYVFGDLCTGEVLTFLGGQQELLFDGSFLISSFGEDEAGELYVVDLGGTVFRLGVQPGSGNDTVSLYDPSRSRFFLRNSNTTGVAHGVFNFGAAGLGWVALAGDWNGDGIDTVGLYDPANARFFLRNSNTAGVADTVFNYGPAGVGWIPIVGDWNGDGVDTVGLYDPAGGRFFLRNSNSSGIADVTFAYGPGGLGWLPIAGDWNGDGADTIGLYDPANARAFLRNSNSGGIADLTFGYGPAGSGWIPIAGDWNRDGITTIGLFDPSRSMFFLRNSNTSGIADITLSYGPAGAGWAPLAGDVDDL